MSPQMTWRRLRHGRARVLSTFAALGLIGGAFAVPAMAQVVTNQPPVAQPDAATTAEDTAVTVTVLANDSDPDGGTLSVAGFVSPTHGSIVVNAATTVTYTPAVNFHGTDTFTYTLSDGQGGTAAGTVTITVTPANDPPVAVADAATAAGVATTVAVLANDTDVDGDTLSVSAVTQGAHGSVAISGSSVVYTPASAFTGTDTFTYTASDGQGGTAVGTVTMTVTAAANRPPVAVNDLARTAKNTSVTIAVLANDTDADGGTLTVSATTAPVHGTIVLDAAGTITYTPATDFIGLDFFTYTVRDASGATDVGIVIVRVRAVDDDDDEDDEDEERDERHEGKDRCKDGGWVELGFRNQGLCIADFLRDLRLGDNHDDDDDDDEDRLELRLSGEHGKGKAKFEFRGSRRGHDD